MYPRYLEDDEDALPFNTGPLTIDELRRRKGVLPQTPNPTSGVDATAGSSLGPTPNLAGSSAPMPPAPQPYLDSDSSQFEHVDANTPPPNPLNIAMANRQATLGQKPEAPKPKWWQKLGAAAIGGLAGYSNASAGWERKPMIDARPAADVMLGMPGYQRKLSDWNSQMAKDTQSVQDEQSKIALERQQTMDTADLAEKKARTGLIGAQAENLGSSKLEKAVQQYGGELIGDDGQIPQNPDGTPKKGTVLTIKTPDGPQKVFISSPEQKRLDAKHTEQENWPTITEDMGQKATELGMVGLPKVGTKVSPTEFNNFQTTLREEIKANQKPDKEQEAQWIADSTNPDPAISGPAKAKLTAAREQALAKRPVTNINAQNTRADRNYQYNNGQLDKLAKPVEDALPRLGRLQETINQVTPQADALVAPELLTVMAGGAGSGLRMNEAEIARIVGGRTHLESIKAALGKWQLDPAKGLSITPAQREQIRALVGAVSQKLLQKQNIVTEARRELIDTDDHIQQRQIVARVHEQLNSIDNAQGMPNSATQVKTKAEYDALPSGTEYIGPDGKKAVKR